MAAIDSSPEAMRGALQGLFGWAGRVEKDAPGGGEAIEVSIKSPRGKWHASHWKIGTLLDPETLKTLAYWSEHKREVYVGCVGLTSVPERTWRRGGAALRGHAGALWLDVDCEAPGREGPAYFATVDEAIEVVDACLGATLAGASLVVGSGWGVQYWIPLWEPVPGRDASRLVRALVGWVGELSAKQIDRVWDTTRVMRMPGTMNWRAGPDKADARPAGVIRWPGPAWRGGSRLSAPDVTAVLGGVVSDVLGIPRLDPELDRGSIVDALLERYGGGVANETTGEPGGGWVPIKGVLGDLERIAEEAWPGLDGWCAVLEPSGWERISSGTREDVWQRPGKDHEMDEAGDRSAVVYHDKPELLVVYSDSPATGFSAGLRGGGRRGDAAGVGVISKWRALVDLVWDGNDNEARRHVQEAGEAAETSTGHGEADTVARRLGVAWNDEMGWVEEWGRQRDAEAMESPFMTTMHGTDP